jgi:RNA polymerase sigma-70 factor (ECF subfamily)
MSYELLADEKLIDLLKVSDSEAFSEIYNRYWKRVFFKAISKVKHAEVAEDITQQIFVGIWERREISSILCIDAYLTTAVKYKCISYYESKYSKMAALDEDFAALKEDFSTEHKINYDELQNAVFKAIDRLPEKTKMVFKLSRFEHYTIREIAGLLNISEKAVEYHVTQSLKFMRRELIDFLQPNSRTAIVLATFLLYP